MAGLPDSFRQRAQQQREASNVLLGAEDLATNIQKQVAAIVGQVNATVLESLADVMDYQRVTTGEDSNMQRRRTILERNDAIRKAAARGDWDEFDRLTNERPDAGASPAGGDGA